MEVGIVSDNTDVSYIYSILDGLKNSELKINLKVISSEDALKPSAKNRKDLIILEYSNIESSLIDAIRKHNNSCILVGLNTSQNILKLDDTIHIDETVEILQMKLKLWYVLSDLRQNDMSIHEDGQNAFNVKIWNRRTRFDIYDEACLLLIWEFFLNDKRFDNMPYANNWIQACYSICLKLLNNDYKPVVLFDENDDLYFLTITSLPTNKKTFYDELVECAQLDKLRFISHSIKKTRGTFSLHLLKDLNFDDLSNQAPQAKVVKEEKEQPKEEQKIQVEKIEVAPQAQTKQESNYVPLRNPQLAQDPAKEYVKECGIMPEDIEELMHIEQDIKDELSTLEEPEQQLQAYGKYFTKFATAINMLIEFEELRDVVKEIGVTMLNATDVPNISKSVFFADLIRQDLSLWYNHVFIAQDAQNVHYLDASLHSSCHKIKEYLVPNHNADIDDSDLELF